MNYDVVFQADMMLQKDGINLGGSEDSLELVTKSLCDAGVKVAIISPTHKKQYTYDGVDRLPLEYWSTFCDIKVFFRQSIVSPFELNQCRQAYSWLQDYSNPQTVFAYAPRISNSNFLMDHVRSVHKHYKDTVIYNPYNPKIDEYKIPRRSGGGLPYLYWNSAYEKGLDRALKIYCCLIEEHNLKLPLFISKPKWSQAPFPFPEIKDKFQIHEIGVLDKDQNWKTLANATALFNPGFFPETFGIVYAEANRLGIPVLAADVGAAKEVLTEGNYLLGEGKDFASILNWLISANSRIDIITKEEFSINKVIEQWLNLLEK